MSFKDQLASDMKNVFLNSGEFAEEIVYKPKRSEAKTIKAIVVRERIQPDEQVNGVMLHRQAEIYIANDPAEGITEVYKGQDTVTMPKFDYVNYLTGADGNYVTDNNGNYIVIDTEKVEWLVVDVLEQDYSGWRILIQR